MWNFTTHSNDWYFENFWWNCHYNDVMMGAIASQITSLPIVYSIVYSDADQRKHPNSTSLAFEQGIHRGLVNSPHKWPVTRKRFPFGDVVMVHRWIPKNCIDDKSTLVQAMAWCLQVTSHYLNQCWPISILPYGVTRPQLVNSLALGYITVILMYNQGLTEAVVISSPLSWNLEISS